MEAAVDGLDQRREVGDVENGEELTGERRALAVFGDFPDTFTIVGAVIIVASGLYGMTRGGRDDA